MHLESRSWTMARFLTHRHRSVTPHILSHPIMTGPRSSITPLGAAAAASAFVDVTGASDPSSSLTSTSPSPPHPPSGALCPHPPAIFVSGFLASAAVDYWGAFAVQRELETADTAHAARSIHVCSSAGPVSSLHDRACELFAYIKGGRVDYGAEHSHAFGHERYGREEAGVYPQWSAAHPVHLIGHSMGGNTILFLQAMLTHHLLGQHRDTSADWVRSVTTLSSPLSQRRDAPTPHCTTQAERRAAQVRLSDLPVRSRVCRCAVGTPVVYLLGASEQRPGDVRPLSFGSLLTKAVHVLEFLDLPPTKAHCDLHLDHWRLSGAHVPWHERAWKMLRGVSGFSPPHRRAARQRSALPHAHLPRAPQRPLHQPTPRLLLHVLHHHASAPAQPRPRPVEPAHPSRAFRPVLPLLPVTASGPPASADVRLQRRQGR